VNSLDDDWSREETDYLFDLLRKYDLRFLVVADRWEYPSQRTVEDLKHRYYSVCRKLIRARPASDEASRSALLNSYSFDKGIFRFSFPG
jgi:DNA methyltransferase 1-associated protein 1